MQHEKGTLAGLFDKIFRGAASAEEKLQADRWFNRLDLHKEPTFSCREEEEQTARRMKQALDTHALGKGPVLRRLPAWVRRVAAVLLVAAVSFGAYQWYRWQADPRLFIAEAGSENIRHILLPDGSEVTLNRSARLSWTGDLSGGERRVHLAGEAFFEVAEDASRPFVLESGGILTTVLGTAFNVESYKTENQVRVSLLRGRVRVEAAGDPGEHAELSPGEMMTYHKDQGRMEVKPIAVADPAGWADGGLVFNEIPLQAALDRIAIRYGIVLHYDGGKLQGKTVTASLDSVSWQQALQAVLFMHDMEFHLQKEGGVMIE